jgi:uncharacterized membrane protein YkvA (DUF1232 family)
MKEKNTLNSKIIKTILLLFSVIYLANLTFGFDLIPDNLPLIGNIDEVIATYIALKTAGLVK